MSIGMLVRFWSASGISYVNEYTLVSAIMRVNPIIDYCDRLPHLKQLFQRGADCLC
jgi:hypothetical protein